MIDKNKLQQYIDTYGTEKQSMVAMEECSELIQAISKRVRKGTSVDDNLAEEIADVLVCIEQLKIMYSISNSKIEQWIEYKMNRGVKND